jgi:hypothetical protein
MAYEFPDKRKSTDSPSVDHGASVTEAVGDSSMEDETLIAPFESSSSRFVDLMTFTSVKPNCDCDQCCIGSARNTQPSQIPDSFRSALREYKRQKLTQMPLRRSQLRTLLGRSFGCDPVAVWQWTMPPHADPLVEFGNHLIHRIIWIQRLHCRLILKHVGTGILGSREEEEGRKQLDWVEDDFILVSSEGTKSIGYIVENVGDSSNAIDCDKSAPDVDEIVGPAVLYVAKVQLRAPVESIIDHVESRDEEPASSTAPPFEVIRNVCVRSLHSRSDFVGEQNSFKIDCTNKELVRQAILSLVNKSQIVI